MDHKGSKVRVTRTIEQCNLRGAKQRWLQPPVYTVTTQNDHNGYNDNYACETNAKGMQLESLRFDETFTHTPRSATVQLLENSSLWQTPLSSGCPVLLANTSLRWQ